MERVDNYALQAQQAKRYFLRYDQTELIAKLKLKSDENYIYVNLLCEPYRIRRDTGTWNAVTKGAGWTQTATGRS